MRIKLSDYVARFLAKNNINQVFTVTGGGAMHLNDSFGHNDKIKCLYNHHEQACAIAAEAYARINNKPAILCVTTGPGGINSLTGVAGAYLDSLPMIVISGQVRYDTTVRYAEQFTEGYKLRAVGDQEFDITKCSKTMCKYATMLENPNQIKYCLEKAIYLSQSGRMGPCWIDIPVNFQGAYIETDDLKSYNPDEDKKPIINNKDINKLIEKLKNSKRPVIYAGAGIRLSGGYETFKKLLKKIRIPVVTCWDSIDLIETTNKLYTGRGGIMGDRAGNFAVQNSDLVLAIGNRLSIRQVGYNFNTWAREAYVAMVDIDPAELRKPTIHVDLKINADAREFLEILSEKIDKIEKNDWVKICNSWKEKYPVTNEKHWQEDGKYANVYAFINYLSSKLEDNNLTVVSNGSACVVGSHNYIIKEDSRFIINSAIASMGYGLPAAIGACISANKKETICIEGDGSIMMNLQELQTIITNKLPIKIFVINNNGYHSIRQTQNNLFPEHTKVGIGPESQDLSFPEYKKIANAFGFKYYSANSNEKMKIVIDKVLKDERQLICEIFVSPNQLFEPKSATKKLSDGKLISPPLEDMAPFLPREELLENLYIESIINE